ncbi:histidine kinase [Terrimonas sp. NA20]|uniref:Histidine kinase n=1 Tax=Terrimonas ginsenosidimutans TaxID=2908004 RepID=A0ABS9KNZ4_9BACT|nr:histidine kinase [Terrimonas ginsenosidimutans]MCG2614035.1 histidine kinase [Terrimonas ginsenosidimutans]
MISFFQRLFSLPLLNTSRQTVLIMLCIFPWSLPLCNYIWLGPVYFTDWKVFITGTILGFIICFGLLLVQTAGVRRIILRFPEFRHTPKRVIRELLLLIIISLIADFCAIGVYKLAFPFFDTSNGSLYRIMVIGFAANICCVGIYESYYTLMKWREKTIQAEAYKRESLLAQLDVLKNQVNPHFLFNGLNTLSSLISENPVAAETFVNEFSKVYRYMLQINTSGLCTLKQELEFIRSYYFLLQSRYSEGLELEVNVPGNAEEYYLPSLTLQLLVENAVKHNSVMRSAPLHIIIEKISTGKLRVINNVQKKLRAPLSNGVGLNNIRSKYQLLGKPAPVISNTGSHFSIELVLLSEEEVQQLPHARAV